MVNKEETRDPSWVLYVDGTSSAKGYGVGVILEREGDIMIELSIKFNFLISKNQAKYEALIAGLQLCSDVGVIRLMICSDSQIVMSQVARTYQAKDLLLQKYLTKVKELMGKIDISEIQHVPWEENVRADILSKLASIKTGGNNKCLIQETLKTPSIVDSAMILAM